jgi:hypothetical protein
VGIGYSVLFVFGRRFFVGAWETGKNIVLANLDTCGALSTGISYLFSVFNTLFLSIGKTKDWKLMSILRHRPVILLYLTRKTVGRKSKRNILPKPSKN